MLAWSLSFLCSIFTLRNLGRRREQRGCTPLPKLQLQNAARDPFASREMGKIVPSPPRMGRVTPPQGSAAHSPPRPIAAGAGARPTYW